MNKIYKWFIENIAFLSCGKYWKGIYLHCISKKYCIRIYLWGVDYHNKPKYMFK